ncbi:response regulator [Ideonella margarita]|uniref:Response regulator n=1 Tax=Ideonella margarita TaxID=2984191 RepID=A0ABU9C763_9BURK
MPTSLPNDVLTTQQAARLLGISTTSVQKMVGRGELAAWVTPGGHRRIQRAAVDALLARDAVERAAPGSLSSMASSETTEVPPLREALHVLVAEDDPDQAMWLQRVLEAHGANIVCHLATDASQALILLERHRPDLVVTDLVMQPFDGFHLVRTIAAEPAWQHIDVLVLSGLSDDEIAARGGLPPGVARMRKPVGVERLLGYLDAAWAHHAAALARRA